MLEVKYIGEDTAHQVSFRNLSDHVCELSGDFPVKTGGFTLSRIEKMMRGTTLGMRPYTVKLTVARSFRMTAPYSSRRLLFLPEQAER